MAVITKFVVVREGVEKMTFTSKKEADAFDKMLDIADNLLPFIEQAQLGLDDDALEKFSFYLAENKDQLMGLLKGGPVTKPAAVKKASKKTESKA